MVDQATYNPDEPKITTKRKQVTNKMETTKVKKTPSKFFDGLTLALCIIILFASAAYGARIALRFMGEAGSWAVTVIGMYFIAYTIVKLRSMIK